MLLRCRIVLPLLMLLCLATGCQNEDSVVSALEGKGITVSRGLDGSVRAARFDQIPATADDLKKVASISSIQEVHASAPEVGDEIFAILAECPALSAVAIADSAATGKAIESLSKSSRLTSLSLENTAAIDDAALSSLNGNTTIQSLNLSGTKVTDAAIETIASMTGLTSLSLGDTGVTDVGVQKLVEGLPHLKALTVQSKQITDASVTSIGSLTDLETLDLSNCAVTGSTLNSLTQLAKLRDLNLQGCSSINDDAVAILSACSSLANLNVSGTKFTGAQISKDGFPKLASLAANDTDVTAAVLANFKSVGGLCSVALKGTPVTMVDVRKHFPATHQTSFSVD